VGLPPRSRAGPLRRHLRQPGQPDRHILTAVQRGRCDAMKDPAAPGTRTCSVRTRAHIRDTSPPYGPAIGAQICRPQTANQLVTALRPSRSRHSDKSQAGGRRSWPPALTGQRETARAKRSPAAGVVLAARPHQKRTPAKDAPARHGQQQTARPGTGKQAVKPHLQRTPTRRQQPLKPKPCEWTLTHEHGHVANQRWGYVNR
jgi:hypothetical protein